MILGVLGERKTSYPYYWCYRKYRRRCCICSGKKGSSLNGVLFKSNQPIEKKDKAMADTESGKKLWEKLQMITEIT